jgi:hypothetical protein
VANAAGFIQESIWRDEHWRRLSRSAQALYMQLLSQKELDCAGILPLQPNKWAKGCNDLTVDQVWSDLEELQRERFVFFDADTDEAFVRTYMRNSNVLKVPNMRKAARRAALLVGSACLKPLVASELRIVGELSEDVECVSVADYLNPSGTPPKPFPNGSKSTLSEPLPEPTGVGMGVGVPHLGSNSSGEAPPACNSHPENPDKPCHKCRRHREWEQAQEADELEQQRRKRQAITDTVRDCTACDEWGHVEIDDAGTVTDCPLHPPLKAAAYA